MSTLWRVAPSPQVLSALYMEYVHAGKPQGISFRKYLEIVGFKNHAASQPSMDDRVRCAVGDNGLERIKIPGRQFRGQLRLVVLLVDFEDRQGTLPPRHYEDLLLSNGIFPTGSLADYYAEVSAGKVQITGSVHGWLRMPRSYSYYVNNECGTNEGSYPRNARRLAEDGVRAALDAGVAFDRELDALQEGTVTGLFIVHSGMGAETLHPTVRSAEIWSHKWTLRDPIQLPSGLYAATYLVVPHDCGVGVCAHELGHLAFQWQDFYDPNYDQDGSCWDGAGTWDLMAGGSYNGGGSRPAHPAGLHKLQHGWVEVEEVTRSKDVTLDPIWPGPGRVVRVRSKAYSVKQYLLLESRMRSGFDFDLPGEGLLVWRVDETAEMYGPARPGLLLVQADGRHHLESPNDWNQGDAGDPFPGSAQRTQLADTGDLATSFPDQAPSGIKLRGITRDPAKGVIQLRVEIKKALAL